MIAASLVSAPAQSSPNPLGQQGGAWRFASCTMDEMCRLESQTCIAVPSFGNSYIWRAETGELRYGTSPRAANDIAGYLNLDDAQADLEPASDRSILIFPPETSGPGWLRAALFRVRDGALASRYFRLTCETSTQVPPAPPARLPPANPTGPEMELP